VFYRLTRDLHLYLGLFISPFILLFSVSVWFLNHAKVDTSTPTSVEMIEGVQAPAGVEGAQGPAGVAIAKAMLPQVKLDGEIVSARFARGSRRFIFTTWKPGLEATVDLDVAAGTAKVSRRETSVLESLGTLHKMPGPHNADIRGNWIGTRIWMWFADATVYLTLFISISGVYLWAVLKAERAVGFVLLAAGAVSLAGVMYAVVR
jgi:hypothetical protein